MGGERLEQRLAEKSIFRRFLLLAAPLDLNRIWLAARC